MMKRMVGALGIALVGVWLACWQAPSEGQETKKADPSKPVAKERKPIVPGFERFHGDNLEERGRLLLGELNCVACHEAKAEGQKWTARRAPILDQVGSRIQPQYIKTFLSDPHGVEPGSPMPDLLSNLSKEEKAQAIDELTQFLASTGKFSSMRPQLNSAQRGITLYHEIGCVACHGSRHVKSNPAPLAHQMPLGDLTQKYVLSGLTQFLREPHQVRPSGRMPDFRLDERQARDLASFLLHGAKYEPTLAYQFYEGNWNGIPDFAKLRPRTRGRSLGLEVERNTDNFAMRFTGYFRVEKDGEYQFHIWADDAGRLTIDGKVIVESRHPDGADAKVELKAGVHDIIIDFAEYGGEEVLTLEYEGPGVERQPVANSVGLTKNFTTKPETVFLPDTVKIEKGRARFTKLGCASCHQLNTGGKVLASEFKAPNLNQIKLESSSGCLSEQIPTNSRAARFDLSSQQRLALSAALKTYGAWAKTKEEPKQEIVRLLTAYNCYACHERDQRGGVPLELTEEFLTTTKEMGEEGKIPPTLTGVGDKLNPHWFRVAFDEGLDERPYMKVKMPKFGLDHVGKLADLFASVDIKPTIPRPNLAENALRSKAMGRRLVGDKGLSCVACHTFNGQQSTGIHAIDMSRMAGRLREDWFHRYLLDPQAYRPGTRMPTGWPGGKAMIQDVLEGKVDHQIAAVWLYLADGGAAPIPSGLGGGKPIELKPIKEPIIYRNFLQGLSSRGIGVGYPEKIHLAFDVDQFSLATIWRGSFIDASLHWEGRGSGSQRPLGDLVFPLVLGAPFAKLDSLESPWPTQAPKEQGYKFLGYRLDDKSRPIFRYSWNQATIEDKVEAIDAKPEAFFRRELTIEGNVPANAWLRIASNGKIENMGENRFKIDGVLIVRVQSESGSPVVRDQKGRFELLVPISSAKGVAKTKIVQELLW